MLVQGSYALARFAMKVVAAATVMVGGGGVVRGVVFAQPLVAMAGGRRGRPQGAGHGLLALAPGLGFGFGFAVGWSRGVALGFECCLAVGLGGGSALDCGVAAAFGLGGAAAARFAWVRCRPTLPVAVCGAAGAFF